MERHKCKLCARTFANGRALGGHMKAHLATLPLPPKTTTTHQQQQQQQLGAESASSSYSSSGEEQEQEQEINDFEVEEKALVYGLRENPKKNFRFADPEFSFAVDAGSVVVQDRESETESRNPTRRRSKRTRKSGFLDNQKHSTLDVKKLKFNNPSSSVVESESLSLSPSPSPPAPPVEPEPVSSVSDTSPEEDVAMCLMMLSRDVWMKNNDVEQDQEQASNNNNNNNNIRNGERLIDHTKKQEIIKVSKIRGKFRCEKCMKLFRSSQALVTHRKICSLNGTELRNINDSNERIFECPYCFKVFGSGQALGGHKRSHLMGSSTIASAATVTAATAAAENSTSKHENNLIDLNLPAPIDDDDFSVVSDA